MMPSPVEFPLDASGVRSEALTWPERARAVTVRDTGTYLTACELLKGIKALRQKIADTFDPHIKRAFEAHRALCREKADAEAPLTQAERILKDATTAYDTEQERRRREDERRLAEDARRQEEQRRLEEAAALEREAERLQSPELRDEAHALLEQPIPTPTVVVPKSTPKVSGITYRETWKFRIADPAKVPREYLKVDEIKIGGVVRALKGGTQIPGVEVYAEKIAAVGGR